MHAIAKVTAVAVAPSSIRGVADLTEDQMVWRVGKVQDIDTGPGFIPSPGFTIQQDDRPPSLTIIFEDLKTAEQCASSMREIIDKATEIIGQG